MGQAFDLLLTMTAAFLVTVGVLALNPQLPWVNALEAPVREAFAAVAGATVATLLGHFLMRRRLNGQA